MAWAAAVVLALAGLTAGFMARGSGKLPEPRPAAHFLLETPEDLSLEGTYNPPALSPDGRVVVFDIHSYNHRRAGPDRVGTLGAITGLLASQNIYIGSLQSATSVNDDSSVHMHSQMTLEIPDGVEPAEIESQVMALLAELNLTGTFTVR